MTTPSTTPRRADPSLPALAEMLAVEHSAVYATGVAGGVLSGLTGPVAQRGQPLATAAYDAHRRLRDRLAALLEARGTDPPAADAAYRLPVVPRDARSALALLAAVDDRVAGAAHDALTSVVGDALRDFVAGVLADAAVRALRARLAAGVPAATAAPVLPGT